MKVLINEDFIKAQIAYCVDYLLDGQENILQDYPKDSEEYQEAKGFLDDKEAIINETLINLASEYHFSHGHVGFLDDKSSKDMQKHMEKFPCRKWIEKYLKKYGY